MEKVSWMRFVRKMEDPSNGALVFALVIVIAVILFSKPWNYLIAIVLFLAFGLYMEPDESWKKNR